MRPLDPRLAGLFALLFAACKLPTEEPPAHEEPRPHQAPRGAAGSDDAVEAARLIREQFTKHEFRIPMRDGVRLHTAVYVPKAPAAPRPLLMMRTPYSVQPYGADSYPTPGPRMLSRFAPSAHFLGGDYILVHQDVRGKMMSEGTFVDVRPLIADKKSPHDIDESSDTHDTIDWLLRNVPGNNGRVGLWGISYPGFYAAQGAVDAHPALKAISPQAPVTDWFTGDDFHHNGALMLEDAFDFFASFGKPRPAPVPKISWGFDYGTGDRYAFFLKMGPLSAANERHFKGEIGFWGDLMAHGTLDDFWKARDPLPRYRDLKPACLVVGGWFDAEDLFGTLATYRAIERQSPGAKNSLVMGPWKHGGWARTDGDSLGDISFGQNPRTGTASTSSSRSSKSTCAASATRSCPRCGPSRPAPTSGAASRPGPRARPERGCCGCTPGGKLGAALPDAAAFDPLTLQSPAQSRVTWSAPFVPLGFAPMTQPTTASAPEASFWAWFAENEGRLASADPENDLHIFDEVEAQLQRVQEGLTFELELNPEKTGAREFVISGGGDRQPFPPFSRLSKRHRRSSSGKRWP